MRRRSGVAPGIAWLGFRSFWGHLRHLVASVIATDDIDARDWMQPDDPFVLANRINTLLGARFEADSIVESLGRDLFIDYIADCGDSAAVSLSVGRILFRDYAFPDPSNPGETLSVPRGDVLIFGGDTAYPVATSREIHDRVVVPFNQALEQADPDDRVRVVMGIPGNHDWYDGLDGFGRLIRHRRIRTHEPPPATVPTEQRAFAQTANLVSKFVAGDRVRKPKGLVIRGYVPVQSASYFVLPLTRHCHIFAVDRQLKNVDFRQRAFFEEFRARHPEPRRWFLLSDPPYAFGRPRGHGMRTLRDLRLDLDTDDPLILAGDVHHYRRERIGKAVQITAGGGGAFLHPAPVDRSGDRNHPQAQWPDAQQTRSLLKRVPLHVGTGRAGLIAHAVLAVCFAPILTAAGVSFDHEALWPASIIGGLLAAVACALIGGIRSGPFWPIASLAIFAGFVIGLLPTGAVWAVGKLLIGSGFGAPAWLCGLVALGTAVLFGGLVFGAYLAALTLFGLECTQAFTALGHPGFRHFVRLRVRADGTAIDAWCIGLVDPLADDDEPVLVDHFTWNILPDQPC